MGYTSEAELEERLLQKIVSQGYERIKIPDYDSLLVNFRKQLNRFNQKTLEHELTDSEFSRVLNIIEGKTVYDAAKQLRDQFTLELDDGKKVYMKLFSSDQEENYYQVSNQITVVGKYKNR